MPNLSRKQLEAKAELLQKQLDQTLEIYEAANADVRKSAIGHIDSFLGILPCADQKIFWLKLRERLERMNEGSAMHPEAFQKIITGGNTVFPL